MPRKVPHPRKRRKRNVYYLFMIVILLGLLTLGYFSINNTSSRLPQQNSPQELPSIGAATQFGVYIHGGEMANIADASIGAGNFQIIGVFEHLKNDGPGNPNKLKSICDDGFTPLISWETWGGRESNVTYSLADIASGKYDDLLYVYLDRFKKICHDTQIVIRFNHEMEMRPSYGHKHWTPWQGQPEEYTATWRHVVELAKNGGYDNIKWLWSPNRADEYIHPYYPGDKYVDFVGVTLNYPTANATTYTNFEDFYEPNKKTLESFNKPIIIGETGYYNDDEQEVADWINGAFHYLRNEPMIVAAIWFNEKTERADYRIEATEAGKRAFINNMKIITNHN